jgi:hypothetical protein
VGDVTEELMPPVGASLKACARRLHLRGMQMAAEAAKFKAVDLVPVPHDPFLEIEPEPPEVAAQRDALFAEAGSFQFGSM